MGVPKCFELQIPFLLFPYQESNIYTQLHLKPSDVHSSLRSYVLCTGILFLRILFQLVLSLNIPYPQFPCMGFDAPNFTQVPLQLSYTDLRPKPDHLTIKLSVMTHRNVRKGGPTRPEVCFQCLFQRGEKWPPSTTKASLQPSPT